MYGMIMRTVAVGGVMSVVAAGAAGAQAAPAAEDVVARSIAYHDPGGVWAGGTLHLKIQTTYSDEYSERVGHRTVEGELWLSPYEETFRYQKTAGSDVVDYRLDGEQATVTWNGSATIPEEERRRLRIREPAVYRDYFNYLYGMPMKLKDPGTHLDPEVKREPFNGNETLAVRTTYDPAVGDDIWYFYFHPETYALVGYRFFHDEAKNDGEYIAFSGEAREETSGLRLPKARAWYYNADDRHLATDEIMSVTVTMPPNKP